MKQFTVTGMSCAACVARVEKAVSKVNGVESCSVSLLTNSMGVEGDYKEQDIIKAVTDAGYGASIKGAGGGAGRATNTNAGTNGPADSMEAQIEQLKDHETPIIKKRLIASVFFLLILMYFSMGHMMWNWQVPAFMEGNHVMMGLAQMLLTIIIMVINQKFFISGFKSLWHRSPNMDTLVALGASAAFLYSTWALFAMTDAQVKNDPDLVMHYMMEFYFESAAMILTLITVGKMLEAKSKGKTTDALKALMKLAPKTAVIVKDGKENTVPIEQVQIEDIFVVRPGESIPVDGVILEGSSAINESALTGESIPVDKQPGDSVSAATINQEGFIKCRATRVGEDTTLSQIIQMVSDAAATKAPIAKVADKVSGVFVPAVISISIVTFIVWLLVGQTVGYSLARAISVLVISCPCALGLATPVAIMVGNGMGAKNGILFKTAASLEEAGKIDIIALDKTGTITKGEPKVTDLIPATAITEKQLLNYAYSLESKSEHPLAKAICEKAKENNEISEDIRQFSAMPGNGLKGIIKEQDQDKELLGGSLAYIQTVGNVDETYVNKANDLSNQGKTPLLFILDGTFLGIIAVADVMKEDAPKAIAELKNQGIHVVMLTGDNERTAKAIGEKAGVDEVIAGVLPEGKEAVIRSLQKKGRVAMVGDGINDAPALTRADIGIAIGAGADVAIDAANVVLMKSEMSDVPAAIRLSRATLRNIYENLFWAFIYNVIGIPLAAGVYVHLTGWELNPMFGAAAMSLSSFCVVTNALRLNFCKIHDGKYDHKKKKKIVEEGEKTMTKTMKIEGMMCGHCEASVKKALESLEGVSEAKVSHEEGTAVVTLEKEVSDDTLKAAVEAKDYTVLSIN